MTAMVLVAWAAGRPPRVRGRPARPSPGRSRWGETPARAGTTGRDGGWTGRPTGDPRACGDDYEAAVERAVAGGRPPRVRGRPPSDGRRSTRGRETPARAGTTVAAGARQARREGDPRACGDDTDDLRIEDRVTGRPPRVRGRLGAVPDRGWGRRETPARAGTTLLTWGFAGWQGSNLSVDASSGRRALHPSP